MTITKSDLQKFVISDLDTQVCETQKFVVASESGCALCGRVPNISNAFVIFVCGYQLPPLLWAVNSLFGKYTNEISFDLLYKIV